ncbi:uncharacterized protein JCM10292_006437 [Rhodotorula paludigena]|uniref:uncharacterized protein n=1 Tax=Rhodotorula paludigena TaxID=86838 RepID=UPI00316C5225
MFHDVFTTFLDLVTNYEWDIYSLQPYLAGILVSEPGLRWSKQQILLYPIRGVAITGPGLPSTQAHSAQFTSTAIWQGNIPFPTGVAIEKMKQIIEQDLALSSAPTLRILIIGPGDRLLRPDGRIEPTPPVDAAKFSFDLIVTWAAWTYTILEGKVRPDNCPFTKAGHTYLLALGRHALRAFCAAFTASVKLEMDKRAAEEDIVPGRAKDEEEADVKG